jgi:hypothetical protein
MDRSILKGEHGNYYGALRGLPIKLCCTRFVLTKSHYGVVSSRYPGELDDKMEEGLGGKRD